MHPDTRAWLEGLRSFVAAHRESKPLPISRADPAWIAERTVLGVALATRLPEFDRVREARRGMVGADPDPAIVVTTSAAGMEALDQLAVEGSALAPLVDSRVMPVTELEYRLWCIRHPDDACQRHVNLWSWVKTRVPQQRWSEFARFPLREGEAYWLHREGLAGGGECDRRASHLWRWDGRHASLLEAFLDERAAPRLGEHRD